MHWTKLMMVCCGIAVKSVGMLGVSVRNMKAPTENRDSLVKTESDITYIFRLMHLIV